MSFENKTILITGGTSGIGLTSAERFYDNGGTVIITGTNDEKIAAVKKNDRDADRFHVLKSDTTEQSDRSEVLAYVKKHFGSLDILVVNAGIARLEDVRSVTEESYDRVMDINLKGAFFMMQEALELMSSGASMVLTASVAGHLGWANASIYNATKAGVISLAKTFAAELAGENIRVNSVSPGPIETPIWDTMNMSEEEIEAMAKQVTAAVPLGRIGSSEEVAAAITFLASDDASYITGEDIAVDGGMTKV